MNVVFFDVDGVLNSEKYLCENSGRYINPKNIANLKLIIQATGAKLVITSDWRREAVLQSPTKPMAKQLVEELAAAGLTLDDACADNAQLQSRYKDYSRATGVKDYISGHGVTGFVILDDMDMDWEKVGVLDNWIDTDNVITGLTESDAKNAIEIINRG
jgi:hypothetical protein